MILRLLSSTFQQRASSSPGNVLTRIQSQFSKVQLKANLNTFGRLKTANSETTRIYDINTKVVKDVILFKYENPRFYRVLNVFAISQFFFWVYVSHFSYTTLRDAPVPEDNRDELPWYKRINLGENKYRNGITILSFFIGYGILFTSWMFTLRSVRRSPPMCIQMSV